MNRRPPQGSGGKAGPNRRTPAENAPSIPAGRRPTNKLTKIGNGKRLSTPDLTSNKKVLPSIKSYVSRFDDLLAGSLVDLLPKPPSEVRIFISSTFSDFRAERNWLTRETFPNLVQFCSDLGLDFRVVDMRWGVTDDATNEHVTEQLCLSEIATCKRVSLGPNFVVMLGDRFGYQPLPYAFVADEFDTLYKEAQEAGHPDVELLKEWYRRDDNNVPPFCCLKPISENIPNFGNHAHGMEEERKKATMLWSEKHLKLHNVLRCAASSLAEKGIITAARKHDFYKSVTETETTDGILEAESPRQHALAYIRTMDGLEQANMADHNALRYKDGLKVDGQLMIDTVIQGHQRSLKETQVPKYLGGENLRSYKVPWEDGGVNPDAHEEHAQYLRRFCTDFEDDVKRLIKEAVSNKQKIIPQREYYTNHDEALHHAHFCVAKCATFKGQEEPLGHIRDYLGDASNTRPLIVHAPSGVGKTSVVAMAMMSAPRWFGGAESSVRVIRFLGTSPLSGSLYNVLRGLMGQLADHLDLILEPVSYSNLRRILRTLPRFLRLVSRKTTVPVFIFLDSIDQLADEDGAFSMRWLPAELPPRIKMVLSTLPDHGGILANARRRLVAVGDNKSNSSSKSFVEVRPLPEKTGEEIVNAYLKSRSRRLTKAQKGVILSCLQQEPSPLFLKLFLDKALSWRSYTPVDEIRRESTVREAITHLFEDLESKFGRCLMSRALGYLTVGLDGLSEVELEDVLSCDDTVLDEVYVYHDPPIEGVVRLPPLLWARIRMHVNEYLTERRSFGKTTLHWYHRQFIEAAQRRYTSGNDVRVLHRRLAELYLAENGVKRDITLSRRKNLTIKKANRQVTPQPMAATNRRMLQALPYHLKHAGNVSYSKQVALCNLRFLQTRMSGFSLDTLIGDFSRHLEAEPLDHELELLSEALKGAKSSLTQASQMPLELLCRLSYDRKVSPHISSLLDKARDSLENSNTPALLPLYPCLVNLDEVIWTAVDATITSMSEDKTKIVVKIKKTGKEEEEKRPSYTSVVLDAAANKIVFEKASQTENDPVPVLTASGNKLVLVSALDAPPSQGPAKKGQVKGKGQHPTPLKVGEYVLQITPFPSNDTTKVPEVCYLPLKDLGIKVVHMFQPNNDGTVVAIAYNDSQVSLYDVKSRTANTHTHSQMATVYAMLWFGKTFCLCLLEGSSETTGMLILSPNTKYKPCFVRLPGKVQPDSCLQLVDESTLVCLCEEEEEEEKQGEEANRRTLLINIRTGKVIKELHIPNHQIRLLCGLPNSQQSLLLTEDNQVFLMRGSDVASVQLIPELSSALQDSSSSSVTSMTSDEDAGLVLLGNSDGVLRVFYRDDLNMTTLGQVKLQDAAPFGALYLSEEEGLLISQGQHHGEVRVWNWRPIRKSLEITPSKAVTKSLETTGSGSSLGTYGSSLSVVVGEDGIHLYTVSSTGVTVWDMNTHGQVKQIPAGVEQGLRPKTAFLACRGTLLLVLDSRSHKLFGWETPGGAALDALRYLHGRVLAVTKSENGDDAYVLADIDGRYCVTVIDLAERKITHTLPLKETFDTDEVELALTDNQAFLLFKVRTSATALEIIQRSEKRNNLSTSSAGVHVFYSLHLAAAMAAPAAGAVSELTQCSRQLSTVPCLGLTWVVLPPDSLLIDRDRVTITWDVASERHANQRLVKGTKIPQFFRPWWVEGELAGENPDRSFRGASTCMVRSSGAAVVGVGSADGWVLFYSGESGLRIGGEIRKKRPFHHGQVTHLAVSQDGRWGASYGRDMTLKFWKVTDSNQELTSLKLNIDVRQITFSPDGMALAILGFKDMERSAVLLFRIVANSQK